MSLISLGPNADIITAIGPQKALPGQTITLGIKVKNIGDTPGQIWTQIYDATNNTLIQNWNKYVQPGEEWEWTGEYTMPETDWNLIYRTGHFDVVAVVDDQEQKVITIGAAPVIPTAAIIVGLVVLVAIFLGRRK